MSQYIKFLKTLFWIFTGGSASKIVSFLMLPLYTRLLSPADYGISDIVSVYASLMMGISTLCIAESMFVFPKNSKTNEQKEYFSSGIIFTLFLLLIIAIIVHLGGKIANEYNINNSFIQYRWYVYALMISNFIQVLTQQFACAINAMKVYSFTGLVHTIGIALFAILLIPRYNIHGYLLSLILSNLVASIYTLIFSKSYNYFSLGSIKYSVYRKLLKYSIPLIPNSIMWWFVSSINRPLMEEYIGLVSIGIFAIANKLPSIINMIFNFVSQSLQISVCEEYKETNFNQFFNNILCINIIFLLLFSAVISLFRNEILYIIATPQYYQAADLIPLLSLGVTLSCISSLIGTIFAAYKQSKYFFYSSIWGGVASIISNIILISNFGIIGAAISMVISFFVMSIIRMYYASNFIVINNKSLYIILLILYFIYMFSDSLWGNWMGFIIYLILLISFLYINTHTRKLFVNVIKTIKI